MTDPTARQGELAEASAKQVNDPTKPQDPDSPTSGSVRPDIRWKEQCILSQLLPVFADKNNGHTSVSIRKPWHYVTSFSTAKEGVPTADFLNRLHMSEGDKDFVNMTTFERNNLLWSIELSKILYKPTLTTADKSTETTDYEFDKEIPLVFEKMAAEDMDSYYAGDQVAFHKDNSVSKPYGGKLGSAGGEFNRPQTGYGIKSFSWSLIGSNPETVRNDIEATLVLEFQNFEQLSRIRLYEDDKKETTKYSLLDLLGYGPNSPKNESGFEDDYNPAFYEIKAHVKWNANHYQRSDEIITLKDKIKGQKTTLFLTMIDHEFSISQIGTFTLTLTYRARLESLASELRTNVVFPPSDIAKIPDLVDLKAIDKEIELAAKECENEEYDRLTAEREDLVKRAWHASFKNLLSNETLANYRTNDENTPSRWSQAHVLMDKRDIELSGDPAVTVDAYHRINVIAVDRDKVSAWIGGEKTSLGGNPPTDHFSSTLSLAGSLPTNEVGQVSSITAISNIASALDNSDDPSEAVIGNFYNRVMGSMGSTSREYWDNLDKVADNPHPISFIYLGELLDIMAHRAFSDKNFSTTGTRKGSFGSGKMIKVICGPIKLKVKGRPNPYTCSLSDIPISIEAFSDFWYRNVVEKEREIYSFIDFVRDLGSQLINRALGAECAVGSAGGGIEGRTHLKTAFLTLPAHSDGSDPLLNLDKECYDTTNGSILVENLPESGINNPDLIQLSKPEDLFHYIVLYLENHSGASDLAGEEDQDSARGIYHLKIHQGILQSIDFSKTDQPYLRESRFFIHNKNPLVHLSNVYSVQASMVGNTCFYPGDTVYINPIGFGPSLGDPMTAGSLSSVMGLGGYHTIISVSNKISRDFTTDIVAQWTSNGNAEARSSADLTEDGCKDKKGGAATLSKNKTGELSDPNK